MARNGNVKCVCKHYKSAHTYIGTDGTYAGRCVVPGCECQRYKSRDQERAEKYQARLKEYIEQERARYMKREKGASPWVRQ